jgi:hypothetical protein
MNRRDVLHFLGATLFSPLLAPLTAEERWRVGARLHEGLPGPRMGGGLSAGQLTLVATLADVLIPRTNTPGAVDVDVPQFVDHLVAAWYPDPERAEFVAGLDAIDARAIAEGGKRFVEMDPAGKAVLLSALDRRANPTDPAEAGWSRVREAIVFGYVTAEPIATLLTITPVFPGRFDGCVPVGAPQ